MNRPDPRSERGMVTAETITVLPFLVLMTLVLVWVVSLGVTQMRVADAAGQAVRLVSRGESEDEVDRMVADLVPGSTVRLVTSEGRVSARVRYRARLPLVPKVHIDLSATTVAVIE